MTNPFRGLLPFEEEHPTLFFGRDKEIGEIASRLGHRRMLAVTGVSQSGKSSLVLAGVVATLRAGLIPSLGLDLRVAIMKPRAVRSPSSGVNCPWRWAATFPPMP
jgi:hypothetical protein